MMTRDQLEQVSEALQDAYMHTEDKEDYQTFRTAYNICGAALAEPSEPVYWQWRRKDKPWANEYIFAMELQATTDDSEVRKLFTRPASKPEPLTADEVWKSDAIMAVNASMDVKMNDLMKLVRAIEQAVWEKCRG